MAENNQKKEEIKLNSKFMDEFLNDLENNKKLPIREAAIKSTRRQYIKEKDFLSLAETDGEYLKTEINKAIKPKNIPDDCTKIGEKILKILVENEFLLQAVPSEFESKQKYPKRLKLVNKNYILEQDESGDGSDNNNDDENNLENKENKIDKKKANKKIRMFYILNFERIDKKSSWLMPLVILLIFSLCLFPIWPLEVKLGIWWISYILLNILVSKNFIILYINIYIISLNKICFKF